MANRTMIERVAVALARSNGGGFYDPNFYTEEQRNVWRAKAKDAISELYQPTEVMLQAGTKWTDEGTASSVWREMVEAAQKDNS